MVATERIRLADIEEELREAKLEKEALRSALRLLEGHAASPGLPSTITSASTIASTSASPTFSMSTTDTGPISFSASSTTSSSPSQHLPSSLSATSSSRTTARPPSLSSTMTIRPSLPLPASLEVPTTPFAYDAGTPTPRPQDEVPFLGSDRDRVAGTSASSTSAAADLEVNMEEQVSPGDAQKPDLREREAQVNVEAGKDEEVEVRQPHPLEEEKHRPPQHDLPSDVHPLGLEHEPDPWAGVRSASVPAMKGSAGRTL